MANGSKITVGGNTATIENALHEFNLLRLRKPRKFETGDKVVVRIEVELTKAELDIVSGYARGGQIVDIARANGCHEQTVRETIKKVLQRMLNSRVS